MDTFLLYFYYSLPWIVVLIISLMIVVGAGVGMVWPRFLVYAYLSIYFFVNSTTYGSIATFGSISIYTRGSGVMLFPLLFWLMLGAWLCARVSAGFQRYPAPPCNLRPWFLGWFLLL
ncbi:MAG TPA: O-antigen ligase domain-containing protein, partial [Telluria sp.]